MNTKHIIDNNKYCTFVDVTIKFKDSGKTQDVTVALFPHEELRNVNDDEIFFYFNSPQDFIENRIGCDGEDFQIIKVHNMY